MPFPDDPSLTALYPPDLKLKFVEIIHRHGERSTATNFFPKAQPEGTWRLCHTKPLLHAFHAATSDLLSKNGDAGFEGRDEDNPGTPLSESLPPQFKNVVLEPAHHTIDRLSTAKALKTQLTADGTCFTGQLTDKGKQTMQTSGENLRKHYIERLGLFSGRLDGDYHRDVYLRSTDYPRTIESLQYLLHGLHPTSSRVGESAEDLTIHVRSAKGETLYPSHSCSALNLASKAFRKTLGAQLSAQTAPLIQKLGFLGTDPAKPHLFQIHALEDTFTCMRAHDIPLPAGVTDEMMREMHEMTTRQWIGIYEDEKRAGMGIGWCLGDLRGKILEAVEGGEGAVKMAVFSAHDTTVGPILTALKAWDGKYPTFGAMINIELFEELTPLPQRTSPFRSAWNWLKNSSSPAPSPSPFTSPSTNPSTPPAHYIRLLYNGLPLTLPACAPANAHRGTDTTMCTLDAFLKEVDRLVPKKEWEEVCRVEGGEKVAFDWRY
ncbi:histidine phosphatase superfamily [Fimicolochytrium jonesii]|uniref:histidine phosphatase superfamily n=1 Tax=Fimicolochytrium jonesii TaxID=1396493 RepID=UPI0022FED89A|nr:histidine phosphatase superfamily [Fimicolochytrium jonesii]KAI8820376.1 histidine phosphatase superfamily [Fimicolochytrium jonesii]